MEVYDPLIYFGGNADRVNRNINFVGSMPILSAVFETINVHIFNCNLDGVKLEWCDSLKSRAAVSYEQGTYAVKQTYIRFSKAWFKNRNRKNFVEAVLYEMVDLILSIHSDDNDDDLHVFLLDAAFSYFNKHFGTHLKVNYNYEEHTSGDDEVEQILGEVAIERKISSKLTKLSMFNKTPVMKMLTKKRSGNGNKFKCPKQHGFPCYCPSQLIFRNRFYGAEIFALFSVGNKAKCFICDDEFEVESLHAHFETNCKVFNPATYIRMGVGITPNE